MQAGQANTPEHHSTANVMPNAPTTTATQMGTDINKAEQHLAKMKGNPIKRLFRRQ